MLVNGTAPVDRVGAPRAAASRAVSSVLRRLAITAATLLGVTTIVFFFVHTVPGDPIDVMLGENATAADREELRRALGLDRPVVAQYARFLGHAVRGDLGTSLHGERAVSELLAARIPATLVLAITAGLFAAALALVLGTLAARHRGAWIDSAASGFALLGASLPNFVIGPLLVLVFSVRLGWLPVSGADSAASLVLPSVTLGLGMSAILTRLVRAALLDTLSADYVRTARAKGLPERVVFLRHALRSACLPVVTVFGLQLGALLGGAIVTEMIFAWPGIGRLTLEAIQQRDYPLVQGCVLLIASGYVGANLATEIAYGWLDPRVRIPPPR